MMTALLAALVLALAGCAGAQTTLVAQTAAPLPQPTASAKPTKPAAIKVTPTVAIPARLDGLRVVAKAQLPREARDTIALIKRDGPFPYRQDGAVFQNRERLLPQRPRGYYHEYTVKTPGSPDRGARRIVTGDRGEFYYTQDHYDSFVRIWDP